MIDSENVNGWRNLARGRVNSLIGTLIEFRIERRPSGRREVRSICSEAKAGEPRGKKATYRSLPAGETEKYIGPVSLRHLAEDV